MNIPLDKLFHLMAGYIVTITLMPFGAEWALGTCAIVAGIKESWDATGRGTVELNDFLATVAGGAAGGLAYVIIG